MCGGPAPSRGPAQSSGGPSVGHQNGQGKNPNNNPKPPAHPAQQQAQKQTTDCGSTRGIPAGETLLPASPSAQIIKSGNHNLVVTGVGSQVQVALTNLSPAPVFAATKIRFHVGSANLGEFGRNIASHTTSTFRSDQFGVLGAPLSVTVNIDVENDGVVEAERFCTIGYGG